MKSYILVVLLVFVSLTNQAQAPGLSQKYPSLLWEITGNGMKKPSYLFGTMHVSSKLAFHLADSFYLGIRSADMVALETNPESWQEDMSKYEIGYNSSSRRFSYSNKPNEYLTINTLKFFKYDKKIERSLYSSPSTINNLLYRSYGNSNSDFEEDTYLDMYIYQCGKKWGKKVAGVEDYGESMKLMQEAYQDASKEKNRKTRNFDVDEEYSSNKLQEAYRKGNLDQLDSINKLNSFSEAFDEKFLFRRNEIQALSIDSILKTNQTLFVGVGAAHLPGKRGVIEILRERGYTLRPIFMGERDSHHKEEVEKVRVPVNFHSETAWDGLVTVDIPGKFYKFGDDMVLDQLQYADMANGSYYMATRIMTNAWMWGHEQEDVYKKIDSLLYENIPGKIINKEKITRNGYPGFDVLNRTRRGDIQRYNIFITPFEVLFFKMSGNGDYVKNGSEADKFFNSIKIKEYQTSRGWKKYSPPYSGFAIDFPHEPFIGNDGSWIFDTYDASDGTRYRVVRTDIHNYNFVEEDSFDLGLMEESFASSEFIEKQISRKLTTYKGYPALDCEYKGKNGSVYMVRYLIQGPHYYTLVAYGKQNTARMSAFMNSFQIKPYVYGKAVERKDTSLYFSVKTPVYPVSKKEKLEIPRFSFFTPAEDDETENDLLESGAYRNRIIGNDSTGEKIYVSFTKTPRYFSHKDSALAEKEFDIWTLSDTTMIIKKRKSYQLPNKFRVRETISTDTGSSRLLWVKRYDKDGITFILTTQLDTLNEPSDFVRSFYESFSPVDTLKGVNVFKKKSHLFFEDFFSSDSLAHKRAVRDLDILELDSADLPKLKTAISSLSFSEKKYLETKKSLIGKLEDIHTRPSADYLKQLYFAAGDTIELQNAALETLLRQQTKYAFQVFRDIIIAEPPVLERRSSSLDVSPVVSAGSYVSYRNNRFIDELFDSLKLTRTILPDLIPLINLDDYKAPMMNLLARMVDSNYVKAKDYELYFTRFLLEARQEMKKQAIAEKRKAIEKAEESKTEKRGTGSSNERLERDPGNDNLILYATLLLPYWEKNPAVPTMMQQLTQSADKKLKYNAMMLLMRNKKPYPDTLITYYAGLDDYRYQFYTDLRKARMLDKFPAAHNNHLDLAKSKLLMRKTYGKPDTLVYLDRFDAELRGKKGYVYFFKYKTRKEDMSWKIASVGLVPNDTKRFEFDNESSQPISVSNSSVARINSMDLTSLSETKIKDEDPLDSQLKKELKKQLYSRRKSARQFYETSRGDRMDLLAPTTIRR